MFTLSFRTDNAAFEDGAATETCRILRAIAKRLEGGDLEGAARDLNGNTVGAYTLNGRNPADPEPAAALPFSEEEARCMAHHLRCAADKYTENAAYLLKSGGAMQRKAAAIFQDHAAQAAAFAARME